MAILYDRDGKVYGSVAGGEFPDNCPGCNEDYVCWVHNSHEKISSSRNVYHSGSTESGYSFGKGLLGTAVFGPVGAVAGINGKKTKSSGYLVKEGEDLYKVSAQCPKCGYYHEIITKYPFEYRRS